MYPARIISRMIPSRLVMSQPMNINIANKRVIATRNGKSFFKTLFSINKLLSSAAIPITISMLKRLLPITLLTAIALLPVNDDVMETAASGALVPNATMVKPTMIVGILRCEAMLLAPSTKKSDPLIKNRKPTSNNTTCIIIPASIILPLHLVPEVPNQLQGLYRFDGRQYRQSQR